MSNKVTSYETSKALAAVGFDLEVYTGWWANVPESNELIYRSTNRDMVSEDLLWQLSSIRYKAYDCHDLLEWLRSKGASFHIEDFRDSNYRAVYKGFQPVQGFGNEPQEALAKVIIEILKETNNE
jgi:hypothetical protein